MTARRVIAIAVAGACLTVPQSAAAGVFSSTAIPVSERAASVGAQGGPEVATDDDGRSLIAWTVNGANGKSLVKARRLEPDGSLGPELTISDGSEIASSPQLSIGPNGRALVLWMDLSPSAPNDLRARWIEPDNQLGSQITVEAGSNTGAASDSNPTQPSFATTSNGSALVAWLNGDTSPSGHFRVVQARFVAADGSVGSYLFPDSSENSEGLKVEADLSGEGGLLAWKEGSAIKATAYDSSGTAQGLKTPVNDASGGPDLATDDAGGFQLVYRRLVSPTTFSIEYVALEEDGDPITAETLEPASSVFHLDPLIETNSDRRSLATWGTNVGTRLVAEARFVTPGGNAEATTFSEPDPDRDQTPTAVAIGGSGEGAVAFFTEDDNGIGSVWGRILPASGAAPSAVRLSSDSSDSGVPRIAIADNDLGVVAWHERAIAQADRQVFVRRIGPDSVVNPPNPGSDLTGPDILSFAINRSRIRLSRAAGIAARRPRRSTFSLTYSEPATANITVERRRRCRGRRRSARRYRRVATLAAGPLGTSGSASFTRRVGRHRLRAGCYRATAVAQDAVGNASQPKQLTFRVFRR